MAKYRLTPEEIKFVVENSTKKVLNGVLNEIDVNFISQDEKTLRDPREMREYEKQMKWPHDPVQKGDWKDTYLKLRRMRPKAMFQKRMGNDFSEFENLQKLFTQQLKREYPDPKERARAFNRFSKKIDYFINKPLPNKWDKVRYDDPTAPWNQGRNRVEYEEEYDD